MKKSLLLILIFFIPVVYAINTNIQSTYHPLQTLIIELKGVFLSPIKYDDVFFYSGRTYIPMEYDIKRIGENYYIYTILPNKERNYTLLIKNVHYFENGEEKTEDLSYNFTVSGNISSFYIRPGFITTNNNFSISVTVNKEVNIKISFLKKESNLTLKPTQEQKLYFEVGNASSQITKLILSSEDVKYEIPVEIISEKEEKEFNCSLENIKFSIKELDVSLEKGNIIKKELKIINTEGTSQNLSINVSNSLIDIVNISNKIEVGGEWKNINITINAKETGMFSGFLKFYKENCYIDFPIKIKVYENLSSVNTTQYVNNSSSKKCNEIKKIIGDGFGEICKTGEECNIQTIETSDTNKCCLGECIIIKKSQQEEKKGPIIFLLILILLIIIFTIYKKISRVKKSAKEILKERAKKYEEKFKSKEE